MQKTANGQQLFLALEGGGGYAAMIRNVAIWNDQIIG